MRFLANENFPGAAVQSLAAAGHDVVWVRLASPGASDSEVLARAAREQRILLTFERLRRACCRLPAARWLRCCVVSDAGPKPSEAGERLAEVVTARSDWAGHFSVVEPGRVRMRRLA